MEDSLGGLELDLAGVDFCDCSGLNALLRLRHQARERGKGFVLLPTSPAVEMLLSLTSALPLFRTEPAEPGDTPAANDAPAAHPAHRDGSTEPTTPT
ncbi:STAS domain-containing protein [Streptomyces sp. NPDC001068]|uniref:STAS domain-containing protein n=1 Tax=Streptomyces sp. NPDC001068 TaxID=3364544 RepID=UPI0036A96081